ncbi:MAG: hypothetical protein BGP03_28900 [Pseudonocardia sp. 73-21]|nr:MAG: hypothetical protein BGP03_28900 [Pseudonocardia sp. 73-21]
MASRIDLMGAQPTAPGDAQHGHGRRAQPQVPERSDHSESRARPVVGEEPLGELATGGPADEEGELVLGAVGRARGEGVAARAGQPRDALLDVLARRVGNGSLTRTVTSRMSCVSSRRATISTSVCTSGWPGMSARSATSSSTGPRASDWQGRMKRSLSS